MPGYISVIACSFLLALVSAYGEEQARPLAVIREGILRGTAARSAAGRVFHSFKGIPYARAPVGELRLQPPQRHSGWQGIREASAHGSRCPQFDSFNNFTRLGSEDCLFVNVYTPVAPQLSPVPGGLPVMVWVHGGAYTFGSGDDNFYGAHYFMDEDVVLVTFNYRLGPLGFFSTYDKSAPGNYALLDQVMLLEWVRDNIAYFGGDPDSVTVFGESAGGALVSLLVISPLTSGLIHHAISQSGSALAFWGASGRETDFGDRLVSMLNCSLEDTEEIVECLRNVTADELLEVYGELGFTDIQFIPRVDIESERPFLPENPRHMLESGTFNLIPWMVGVTADEEATFLSDLLGLPEVANFIDNKNIKGLGLVIDITKSSSKTDVLLEGSNSTSVVSDIVEFYAINGSLSEDNYRPVVDMLGDRSFIVPMSEEARLASAHTAVYKYLLDHTGPGRLSFSQALSGMEPSHGAAHGDDLLYLFKSRDALFPAQDSPEYSMIRFMVSLWSSFARTGRPSSRVFPMPDWPVFNERSQRHMRLNSKPSVAERLYAQRIDFWQTLPFNEPWKRSDYNAGSGDGDSREATHDCESQMEDLIGL